MKALKKIIQATLNSPKNPPPTPSEMKQLPVFFMFFGFLIIRIVGQFRRKKIIFSFRSTKSRSYFFMKKYHDTSFCILVYNYPQRRSNIYEALFTDPEGDSCFSIHQISWIKIKKGTFCKLKTSLIRNFVYILQTFRGFCQVHFYNFAAN